MFLKTCFYPCCYDERCESVETTFKCCGLSEVGFGKLSYSFVNFSDFPGHGKPCPAPMRQFILTIPQVLTLFFRSSSQLPMRFGAKFPLVGTYHSSPGIDRELGGCTCKAKVCIEEGGG
jgi:hypothetical protein